MAASIGTEAKNSGRAGRERAIERAAAEWCLRKRRDLSALEQAELVQWLSTDRNHADIFLQMEKTARLLSQLREKGAATAGTGEDSTG